MKKILLIFSVMLPFVSQADDMISIKMQMLDSEIENLTHQRDEKYEALKKCEKTTKGFKIAGITTLIATGVGVYGNIKLAQKYKGGGSSSKSGGGLKQDTRTEEQKVNTECQMICSNSPEDAEELDCTC